MEQFNSRELAQQGNIEAIATLVTRSLASEQVTTQTTLEDGCLLILLESSEIPNQEASVALIRHELQPLRNVDFIKTVIISGQQTGKEVPNWTQEFTFRQFQIDTESKTSIQIITSGEEYSAKYNEFQIPTNKTTSQRFDSSEFFKSLKTFRFSAVVPYREALSSELYNHSTVKLLLFFGLFPLIVGFIVNETGLARGLEQTAWVLGIYYAAIWGVVLHNLIRPVGVSWQLTVKCILFTVFIGIPLLLFVQQVPPFSFLYAATKWGLIPRMIGFVLGVGVLEEVTKALPVYIFLLRPRKLREPLTSAFYGSMSGLGFAISEGVVYSVQYALGLVQGELDFGSYVLTNTIRFVTSPLAHAIWAGIVGYFLGLAAINPTRQAAIIFIGVAIAAVLHGLYDTFASGLLGLLVMAFSILLFVAYLRHSQQMVAELQQAEMSQNKFD